MEKYKRFDRCARVSWDEEDLNLQAYTFFFFLKRSKNSQMHMPSYDFAQTKGKQRNFVQKKNYIMKK